MLVAVLASAAKLTTKRSVTRMNDTMAMAETRSLTSMPD